MLEAPLDNGSFLQGTSTAGRMLVNLDAFAAINYKMSWIILLCSGCHKKFITSAINHEALSRSVFARRLRRKPETGSWEPGVLQLCDGETGKNTHVSKITNIIRLHSSKLISVITSPRSAWRNEKKKKKWQKGWTWVQGFLSAVFIPRWSCRRARLFSKLLISDPGWPYFCHNCKDRNSLMEKRDINLKSKKLFAANVAEETFSHRTCFEFPFAIWRFCGCFVKHKAHEKEILPQIFFTATTTKGSKTKCD